MDVELCNGFAYHCAALFTAVIALYTLHNLATLFQTNMLGAAALEPPHASEENLIKKDT